MAGGQLADVSGWVTGEWGKPQVVSYNRRDLLLYAVGIGCGQSGPHSDLRYVYEQEPGFAAFPTYPVVLGQKGDTQGDDTAASSDMYLGKGKHSPASRAAAAKARGQGGRGPLPIKGVTASVDYEKHIIKLREIPPDGARLLLRSRLYGVHQKRRGVVTEHESELYDEDGTVYYRFIGGGYAIGGKGIKDAGRTNAGDVPPPPRQPDRVAEVAVAPTAHLIYRLTADYNPQHIDPKYPHIGFDEPILHGLCTLGHVARAVLGAFGGNDPARFRALKLRFASPVFSTVRGCTLVVRMWEEPGGRIVFDAKVKETGKTVISNAFAEMNPPSARL